VGASYRTILPYLLSTNHFFHILSNVFSPFALGLPHFGFGSCIFNLLLHKALNAWDFIQIVHKPLYNPHKYVLGGISATKNQFII
jgi:hypothetical protein